MKKILITGANGRIGRCLTEGLRKYDGYDIIAADINPNPDLGVIKLDVRDPEAVTEISRGVDIIIHMAWYMKNDGFVENIIPTNFIGTYNVFEAARINGVKRVINSSSNHATGFYRLQDKVTPDSPYRPDSLYGLGKCYAELLGRMYLDKYGVSSIHLRIGHVSSTDKPGDMRKMKIWISRRDMVQLAKCCIEADESFKYLVLYGTSNNTRNMWDISYLENLIGYKPQDNSETYYDKSMEDEFLIDEENNDFQGGEMVYR